MRLNAAQKNPRYKIALSLRTQGLTFREIGEILGVTRGRAWQIVNIGRSRKIRGKLK